MAGAEQREAHHLVAKAGWMFTAAYLAVAGNRMVEAALFFATAHGGFALAWWETQHTGPAQVVV